MPFKSKSQERLIAWKESEGELPKGTFKKWKSVTPDIKHLPEHIKKAGSQIAAVRKTER